MHVRNSEAFHRLNWTIKGQSERLIWVQTTVSDVQTKPSPNVKTVEIESVQPKSGRSFEEKQAESTESKILQFDIALWID